MRLVIIFALPLVLALTACVEADDHPTTVKDLRILGISFETPEVLVKECDFTLLSTLQDGSGTLPPEAFQSII